MILGSKLLINDFDLLCNDQSFFICVLLNNGFSNLQYNSVGRAIRLKTSFADLFVKRCLKWCSVFSRDDTLSFLSNQIFKFSEFVSSTPRYLYKVVALITWWLYMTYMTRFLGSDLSQLSISTKYQQLCLTWFWFQ